MADNMQCRRSESSRVTGAVNLKRAKAFEKHRKTRFNCILEAHEATRQRIESVAKKNHERPHCRQRTKFNISLQLGAQIHSYAACDENSGCKRQQRTKNGKKLETIPAWQLEKVRSKKVVIKRGTEKQK